MNDQIKSALLEYIANFRGAADVYVIWSKISRHGLEPFQVPQGIALWPKEQTSHVIVHADHTVSLAIEVFNSF